MGAFPCKVSWSGVSGPTVSDAIALYVLDNVTAPAPTVDTLSPLRFTWAKTAVGGNAAGAGNLTCAPCLVLHSADGPARVSPVITEQASAHLGDMWVLRPESVPQRAAGAFHNFYAL